MTIEAIAKLINRKPFVPIAVHLQDHARYYIMHPEFVLVAEDALYISEAIPGTNKVTSPIIIGYENIVRINRYEPNQSEEAA